MPREGAHHIVIENRHAEAVAALKGLRWQCPHVHVSGRRCGVKVVARLLYCDAHSLSGDLPCDECRAMASSFGVSL